MIRLVLLLCLGLYVMAMIFGADHGQKRSGLLLADSQSKAAADAEPEPQSTLFIPAQPVMQTPVAPVPAPPVVPEPVAVEPAPPPQVAAPEPAPEPVDSLLYTVAADQANVRGGPGRGFAVVGSVSRGEQVRVMIEDQPLQGWSRIRVEDAGIEGYVSTRLLTRGE